MYTATYQNQTRKAEQQHYKTNHEKQNNNITKQSTKSRTTTLLNQTRKAKQQHYKTKHEKQNNNITKLVPLFVFGFGMLLYTF
jgi:thiol:disulfide interchange protein